jgi:hypothetical protein
MERMKTITIINERESRERTKQEWNGEGILDWR